VDGFEAALERNEFLDKLIPVVQGGTVVIIYRKGVKVLNILTFRKVSQRSLKSF
jgi:hypothetical protein